MSQTQQRVLIVENDPDVLAVLAQALREAGYRVSTAQSRGRALAILRRAKVDLIVADSVLNGRNGEAVAIGAETQGIPVIFISGDPARIKQLRVGPVPFLAKPFRLRDVVDLVKRLIP
jgi:DNA-binding response OmpR family regulator